MIVERSIHGPKSRDAIERWWHYVADREAHYNARQTDYEEVILTPDICLKTPRVLGSQTKKMPRTRTMQKAFRAKWTLRGHSLPPCRMRMLEENKPIPNIEKFHCEFDELRNGVESNIVPSWLQNSVAIPVGPKQIEKILKKKLHSNTRKMGCLTFNPQACAFVFAEGHPDDIDKIRAELFGEEKPERRVLEIAEHGGGHSILLRDGEEPLFVSEANKSTRLVIFESGRNFGDYSPDEYYRKVLPKSIRILSMRPINTVEKRIMLEKYGQVHGLGQKMRMLEFSTPEDRTRAIPFIEAIRDREIVVEVEQKQKKYDDWKMYKESKNGVVDKSLDFLICDSYKLRPVGSHLDLHICDTMFDPMRDVYCDLRLNVTYKRLPKFQNGVKVVLRHETDKLHAKKVLAAHTLTVHYYNRQNIKDYNLKYTDSVKWFVVENFPIHCRTIRSRIRVVKSILDRNNIQYSSVAYHWATTSDVIASAEKANVQSIQRRIEYEMYRYFHGLGLYNPNSEAWVDDRGRGCCNQLDTVNYRADVPWYVVRNDTKLAYTEDYDVHFKNIEQGLRVVKHLLHFSYIRPVMCVDRSDSLGPDMQPLFRKMFPVSREIRCAYKRTIRKFANERRASFHRLAKTEHPAMNHPDALHWALRFYENWRNNENMGEIGMEGWSVTHVSQSFKQLRKLLAPVRIVVHGTARELLHGIGEVYVRYLETMFKGRVVVEVDKFSGFILVYGDLKKLACKKLLEYHTSKAKIFVTNIQIPVYFPFINDATRSFLTEDRMLEMAKALGSKIILDASASIISFSGTVKTYELFMNELETLSTAVFRKFVSERRLPLPLECPVCLCETGINADFFRLQCGHSMCRDCANLLIKAELDKVNFKMECPAPGCEKFLTPTEIEALVLGDDRRLKHRDTQKMQKVAKRARQAVLNSSQELKACVTPDCVGVYSKSDGDVAVPKNCFSCRRFYCRQCLSGTHPEQTCDEFQRLLNPDESIAAYVKDLGTNAIRECPYCHNLIEKNGGCNHVECVSCNHHFCWVCGFNSPLSKQVYEHMTEFHGGPGGDIWVIEGTRAMNIGENIFPAHDPGEGAPFRFILQLPVDHGDEHVRDAVLNYFNSSSDHGQFAQRFREIYHIGLPPPVRH